MECDFCGKSVSQDALWKESRAFCDQICYNRDTVLSWFHGRCAMNPAQFYDEIHEIIPKSVRPSDWWELDNMVPLSAYWHRKIHREGTRKYREILQEKLKKHADSIH